MGQFVFFSTTTGDAWLLEPGEQLALELARNGEKQAFTILETPDTVAQRDSYHSLTGEVYATAVRLANAAQKEKLDAEIKRLNVRTEPRW